MSASSSSQSSSLPASSSQSSLLASRSSNSQLQLSTSSLPARTTSPAAVHSGSPASDESLSSDWHNDESPPDDASGAHDEPSVFDSMTDSQFITHEEAAEAAAALQASAANLPIRPTGSLSASNSAVVAPSSSTVPAAPSEDSAAAAIASSAVPGASNAQKDSSWLSAIRGVQQKGRAESKDADSKEEQPAVPQAAAEHEAEEKVQPQSQASQPAADESKALVASDSAVPSDSSASSPTLYSRMSSLLSSISSSPVLPGALLSISMLAVGFVLGRAWQRRQYSLAAQQHADAVHNYLTQQHRANLATRPFSRGGTGAGPASSGGGLVDTTRRLVSAIMGEQEKEISRWLGLLQDGVLTPVMVRYIQ